MTKTILMLKPRSDLSGYHAHLVKRKLGSLTSFLSSVWHDYICNEPPGYFSHTGAKITVQFKLECGRSQALFCLCSEN